MLLVDEINNPLRTPDSFIQHEAHTIEVSLHAEHALERCAQDNYDIVIVRESISGISGKEIIKKARLFGEKTQLVYATETPNIKSINTFFKSKNHTNNFAETSLYYFLSIDDALENIPVYSINNTLKEIEISLIYEWAKLLGNFRHCEANRPLTTPQQVLHN